MLKHVFVAGLAVVGIMLASPCHAQLIDPNDDVEFHHALVTNPTTEAALTAQILGVKGTVVGAYASEALPPAQDAYYSDSHSQVFGNLEAGASGIIALDKFDPTRTNPGTNDTVGKLRGVLLYLTVHLKGGRLVLDNETTRAIQTATLQIGANLNVTSRDATLGVNFASSPFVEVSGSLAADVNTDGSDPFDGQWPSQNLTSAQLDQYSTGADKLAAIIDPADPNNFFEFVPIYVDLSEPAEVALFTDDGSGETIDFVFNSSPYGHVDYSPSQLANAWSSKVTFDLEARLVYLYAEAIPEPTSMALLGACLTPILARRLRRRKSRLA